MDDKIFDKYRAELEQDLAIDEFRVKETQLKLPSVKHKWVARLIQHKQEKGKLASIRQETIDSVVAEIRNTSPIAISDRTVITKAENTDSIRRIDSKIQECGLMIDYLERVEKICSSVTYDIRNLIELHKLETT